MFKSFEEKLTSWLAPLKKSDGACYLVGGAVRDRVMGRSAKDMDFVCEKAKHVAEKIASVRDATIVPFTSKSAAACYRVVSPNAPNDTIDIADIRGGSITADLACRDFTLNAMAIKIKPGGRLGKFIDPFHGVTDIKNKHLRLIGPDAFIKDPLRILRAIRFSVEFNFSLSDETIDLIRTHAELISDVAGERIWAEFRRILQQPNSTFIMRWLDEWRVLTQLFPDIDKMKACPQNAHHHLDVWPHSLMVLRYCERMIHHPGLHFNKGVETVQAHFTDGRRVALLKLAALLHDVGKPHARGINPSSGRMTFYGHDKIGADLVGRVADRLKLSNEDRNYLVTMVAQHLHVLSISHPHVRPSTRTALFRKLNDDTISLIIHGMADVSATKGPDANQSYRQAYIAWAKKIIANFDPSIKPLLSTKSTFIGGKDLLALGARPGPIVGEILGRIQRAQDDGQIQNRPAALKMAKEWLATNNHTEKEGPHGIEPH